MNCLFNLPENLKYKLKTRIILKTVLKLIVISLVVGYGGSGEFFFFIFADNAIIRGSGRV